MPIVVASASRSADALINYALDDKANQQGERYVMASGVGGLLVSVAKQQMRDVRKKWRKDRPGAFVQAYHVIESFAKDELLPDDPDSWMTAQQLGRALAEDRFPGRQALIVTQRDGKTGCVHNHIVVNSIETKTGKSLDSSIVMHSRLVEAHERVLEAEGFEQRADLKQAFSDATDRRDRGEPSGLRRADSTQRSELREFQRYIIWETDNDIADEFGIAHEPEPFSVTVLKSRIEQALADPSVTDWHSFVEAGRAHCVHIEQRGKKGRGISYGMLREQSDGTLAEPLARDRRRCSSLGIGFEMDAVEETLARNGTMQQAQAKVAPVIANVSQPTPPARQDKPAQQKPAMKDQLRAGLDQANERANAITQPMIAAYITAKAAEAELLESYNSPAQPELSSTAPAPAPVPGATSLSALRPTQDAQEAAHVAREAASELETTSEAPPAETDAEKLCRINKANRRLGLPPVSLEQLTVNQALTPQQREWKRTYPELSDDTQPATKPSKEHDRF